MAAREIIYQLKLDGHEPDEFLVLDFEAREALSDGCVVHVRASSAKFIDGQTVVGKPANLSISFGEDDPRRFHGVVTRAGVQKTPSGGNLLEVEIRSRVWLLSLGRDNRIFTKIGVKAVVEDVLKRGKIPAAEQEWKLAKDPPEVPHIFQREESDLAFIQRLLAREGIGYVIHSPPEEDGKDKILLFDDSSTLPFISGEHLLTDRTGSPASGVDQTFDVRELARVRPDTVMMRDYDPKLPGANLDVTFPPKGGTLENYLHPGNYVEATVGKRLAERTLQSLAGGGRNVMGRSDCPRLEAGRRFTLEGHRRLALNAEYLLVEVVHRGYVTHLEGGREVAYDNTFTASLKEQLYRPAQPALPRRGQEVAFVTCPPGEEIHVDEFGRSTVRFMWDRSGKMDDKSSNFLRVGQLALGGSMILPRKDFEVLIDFELGEIDRPYILGHLYNGKSPPPYALPQGATVSSIQTNTTAGGGGANEIRFEDAAGSEEIFLNASKDLTISIDNDATYDVAKNETYKVGVNTELDVGTNFTAEVVSNRKLQIAATQSVNVNADFSDTVGGNSDVTIGGARKVQCGGDHSEATTGKLSRTVGGLQSVTGIKSFGRNVVGNSQVSVGAAWMEVVGRSRASTVNGSRKETIAALKLIKAKQVSVSVTGNLTINAAAESVTCGGSRTDTVDGALAITTGGGLSVKAKNITIEGKNTLVMMLGGCIFKLAKGGKILIKAANIDLKGAKTLGQGNHKSG